jgi:hypothetical protein
MSKYAVRYPHMGDGGPRQELAAKEGRYVSLNSKYVICMQWKGVPVLLSQSSIGTNRLTFECLVCRCKQLTGLQDCDMGLDPLDIACIPVIVPEEPGKLSGWYYFRSSIARKAMFRDC